MGDYFREFRHFDAYAQQAQSIADFLASWINGPLACFADIGSNSGSLAEKVLPLLKGGGMCYATEPGTRAFASLRQRFHSRQDVQLDNLLFEGWLEKYRDELHDKVDLLLNSHTFYHFPKDSWRYLIDRGSRLLNPGGSHVIILDSDKTSVNELKGAVEEKFDRALGGKRAYGKFLFGRKLQEFFEDEKIPYQKHFINHPITIPAGEESMEHFARILGFMIRYDAVDLLMFAAEDMEKYMALHEASGIYSFPGVQEVFVLKK